MRSIQQIINAQVQRWDAERRAQRDLREAEMEPRQHRPWVTIARDFGSGGSEIAAHLAARLGYDFYDREILDAIAEESNYRTEFLESLDERRRSAVEAHVDALLHGQSYLHSDFLRFLMRVVLTIGKTGHAVLLGRGANYILPADEGVTVRVIAPFEIRVDEVAQRLSISHAEAKARVEAVDQERAEFHRMHFQRSPWRAEDYDLVVNTARVSRGTAVQVIRDTLVGRFPEEREAAVPRPAGDAVALPFAD